MNLIQYGYQHGVGFHPGNVQRRYFVANKEQKKVQKAPPKSNKQKKEMQKEKKAAKSSKQLT